MAVVLTGSLIKINNVDYSAYASKFELTCDSDEVDITTFTSSGNKSVTQGLKNASLKVTFNSDVAATLDGAFWTLYQAGNNVTFEVAATTAVAGASNPHYSGSVMPKQWNPLGGQPGAKVESDITWPVSGAVTRTAA